ncbi:MAG: CRISPR-associated endonuclease Cas1 [Nitrosopumilales archaeon CG11_big_fil_rev_8_21_14_0_20_33_24]|nr:MAG: CRISPR-associated endonuclease Cas1 [Nitrosopumilales archaeon CG11_big_fil_rev_8_21_14_0_20_33_24]
MQTHQQFIKVLKGYGFSVSVKDNKIVLKNAIPFQENIPEEHYANNLPYEKIVLCGKGYVSTEAMSLLCEKNCSLVLMDTFGEPIAFVNPVRESFHGSRYRMAQYDTFRIPEKREYLARQIVKSKIQSQIDFLKYTKNEQVKGGISTLSKYLHEVDNVTRPNGIEAKSSAVYFAEYAKLIPSRYDFQGRNQSFLRSSKEQATDMINGLLNYGYTVLASEISKLINTVGLDAYYGFYHAIKSSFQSLVYDMIEPFRWLVDWAVYSLCHEKNTVYPKLNEIAHTRDGLVVMEYGLIGRFLEKLYRIFRRTRKYDYKFGLKTSDGLKSVQEITVAKIMVQNLAEYCLGKQKAFKI